MILDVFCAVFEIQQGEGSLFAFAARVFVGAFAVCPAERDLDKVQIAQGFLQKPQLIEDLLNVLDAVRFQGKGADGSDGVIEGRDHEGQAPDGFAAAVIVGVFGAAFARGDIRLGFAVVVSALPLAIAAVQQRCR